LKKTLTLGAFLLAFNFLYAQSTKPNIIYIYADDLGYGEIGANGQSLIKTSKLEKMAQEGMRFT
jgi:arylsulfatase A-like enzyme